MLNSNIIRGHGRNASTSATRAVRCGSQTYDDEGVAQLAVADAYPARKCRGNVQLRRRDVGTTCNVVAVRVRHGYLAVRSGCAGGAIKVQLRVAWARDDVPFNKMRCEGSLGSRAGRRRDQGRGHVQLSTFRPLKCLTYEATFSVRRHRPPNIG